MDLQPGDQLRDAASARRKGAMVVCSDNSWLWQSAFVLRQAIDSDPERRLDYYYACDFDASESPLARLLPPEVTVMDLRGELVGMNYRQRNHIPKAGFLRFLALEKLSEKYEQAIYVDGDIFLCWGSWVDLVDLPGRCHAVAAVASRSVWFDRAHWRYGRRYRRSLSVQMGDRYLNSGVLLVDGKAYRSERIAERSMEFYQLNPDLCPQDDQSALNGVLQGEWDELSPSWNWQVSQFNFPTLKTATPRAIHFTGPIKPWSDTHGLFSTALEAMLGFLVRRGAIDSAVEIISQLAPGNPASHRLAAFRESWVDRADAKADSFKNYLRRDFLDTRAGLSIFAHTQSGFGELRAPNLEMATLHGTTP